MGILLSAPCCGGRNPPLLDDPKACEVGCACPKAVEVPASSNAADAAAGPSCSCQAFKTQGTCRHIPPELGGAAIVAVPAPPEPTYDKPQRVVTVDEQTAAWYMNEGKTLQKRPDERCGVFLDIDGVVHHLGAYGDDPFNKLGLFVDILEATGAGVVLSSSWRLDKESIQEINDRLSEARPTASNPELLDIIRRPRAPYNDFANRDLDIQHWLSKYADAVGWNERWIALDDVDMTSSLTKAHMVATDGDTGLTAENVSEAICKLDVLCQRSRPAVL